MPSPPPRSPRLPPYPLGFTLCSLLLTYVLAVSPLHATNFIVSTTFDAGAGTLRQAILDANAAFATAPHQISFNIPGIGVHTIALQSELPDVLVPVTIDGYTQPGASPNTLAIGSDAVLLIEIDGSALPDNDTMLTVQGDDLTLSGLAMYGIGGAFGSTLRVRSPNAVVEGNFFGLDASGAFRGAGDTVVMLFGATGCQVGGPLPWQRNVMSGTNRVLGITASDCVVQGNYVGLNPAGTAPASPDQSSGIFSLLTSPADQNVFGGSLPGEGNVLGGFNGAAAFGIAASLSDTQPVGTVIHGNIIGFDATGRIPIPNNAPAILLGDVGATEVGGPFPGEGNLIGNSTTGVWVSLNSTDVVIQGNTIGLDVDGNPAPNSGWGVRVSGSSNTTIGGTNRGEPNVIAWTQGTPGVGVSIERSEIGDPDPATNNRVLANSIYANRELGIDLFNLDLFAGFAEGPTANDPLDADDGANGLQNFPVLTDAFAETGLLRVIGRLDSAPNQQFAVQVFSDTTCHPSGYGEGRTFLGTWLVTTDGTGSASIDAVITPPPSGEPVLAATATDESGNTSEFGPCLAANVLEIPTMGPTALALFALLLLLLGTLVSLRTVR